MDPIYYALIFGVVGLVFAVFIVLGLMKEPRGNKDVSEISTLIEKGAMAKSGEPVINMLRRLESAPQFGPTTVHNWLPPSQTEPLYRYRVSVQYAQKL